MSVWGYQIICGRRSEPLLSNCSCILYLPLLKPLSSRRPVFLFSFADAVCNLPDRTLIFVSAAWIEMVKLGSFSLHLLSVTV
jgi:hypothetical protein